MSFQKLGQYDRIANGREHLLSILQDHRRVQHLKRMLEQIRQVCLDRLGPVLAQCSQKVQALPCLRIAVLQPLDSLNQIMHDGGRLVQLFPEQHRRRPGSRGKHVRQCECLQLC